VQVEPIKPTLKAPGSKRLKLKYDKPHSSFAFKFNLRRYTLGLALQLQLPPADVIHRLAGAYTRPLSAQR
jgi:hypothetical protein